MDCSSVLVAYLAPEIPSVSATFVYQEIGALIDQGHRVASFSLHPVPVDAAPGPVRATLGEVSTVYGRPVKLALDAGEHLFRHPIRSLSSLGLALRDVFRGRFSRRSQRLKVLPQWVAGLGLANRLSRKGAGHLHIHFAHSPTTIGMYAACAAGISFTVTSHANDLYVEASLLKEKVQRSDVFFTISEANRTYLRETLPRSLGELPKLARCGVDLGQYPVHPSPALDGSPLRLVTVARLVRKKGIDLLVDAVQILDGLGVDVVVEVLGDGPERETLERLVGDKGLADRVRFHGAVAPDEVRRCLRQALGFVLPCRVDEAGDRDGIPVALMEAMANRIPVVTTPLSGIPELIDSSECGLLVPAEDPFTLALTIRDLLGDPDLRQRLGDGGRRRILQEFNLRTNAAALGEVFQACLISKRGSGATVRSETFGRGRRTLGLGETNF